jgi:hypothetical protein
MAPARAVARSLALSGRPAAVTAVFLHLTINEDRDEAVLLDVLEPDDLMPGTRASWPHWLGFSGFCSMAVYSRLPIVNLTVFRRWELVRRTGTNSPFISIAVPFAFIWLLPSLFGGLMSTS